LPTICTLSADDEFLLAVLVRRDRQHMRDQDIVPAEIVGVAIAQPWRAPN
jgi:hypothetical protein